MTGCLPYRTNLRILYRLAEWCADRQLRLIVDESFADFSSEYPFNTMLRDETLEAFPDLIVVKSISKSYGVPGLRLGLIASSVNMSRIMSRLQNVSVRKETDSMQN